MKLDHTFIAIRERGILEIFDLSLHVIRDYFKPLVTLLLIGAAPWILVDCLITGWLIVGEFSGEDGLLFYWIMALLVISQAQVGTTLITHYLGQAMFVARPGIRASIADSLRTSYYFVWSHGAIRLVIPVLLVAWLTRHADQDTLIGISALLLPFLVFVSLLTRGLRPFASEMLLLEKTPVRTSQPGEISFARRSKSLHGSSGSDLFGRLIVSSVFLVPLTLSFFSAFVTVDSTLNLQANSEVSLFAYYWIAALWMTAGFAAVVRFLSYVDVRIRQEGWAVELRMRAEGLRIAQAIE